MKWIWLYLAFGIAPTFVLLDALEQVKSWKEVPFVTLAVIAMFVLLVVMMFMYAILFSAGLSALYAIPGIIEDVYRELI